VNVNSECLANNDWHNRAAAVDVSLEKRVNGGSAFMPLLSHKKAKAPSRHKDKNQHDYRNHHCQLNQNATM
jgi:hypothetical protein